MKNKNGKMTKETLKRANAIKKTIDKLEIERSTISKLYSKKEELNEEEIKELFSIAMINTDYTLKAMNKELSDL